MSWGPKTEKKHCFWCFDFASAKSLVLIHIFSLFFWLFPAVLKTASEAKKKAKVGVDRDDDAEEEESEADIESDNESDESYKGERWVKVTV